MRDAERRRALGIEKDVRKQNSVFVSTPIEGAFIGIDLIPQHTQPLPRHEILRDCESDTWFVWEERRVCHDEALEPEHVDDACVFAAAAASTHFVWLVARIIAFCNEPWEEMHRAIGGAGQNDTLLGLIAVR